MSEQAIGKVTDFFAKPVVAGILLDSELKVGEKIHIVGHTTDLELVVQSMQIDRVNLDVAKKGDMIGIKVPDRVRAGDIVYRVDE